MVTGLITAAKLVQAAANRQDIQIQYQDISIFFLYAPGVSPVFFLNSRVKLEASHMPMAAAICAMPALLWLSSIWASSISVSSIHAAVDLPVTRCNGKHLAGQYCIMRIIYLHIGAAFCKIQQYMGVGTGRRYGMMYMAVHIFHPHNHKIGITRFKKRVHFRGRHKLRNKGGRAVKRNTFLILHAVADFAQNYGSLRHRF